MNISTYQDKVEESVLVDVDQLGFLHLESFRATKVKKYRIECTPTREYVNIYEAWFKLPRSMSSLNVIMCKGFVEGDFQFDSF